jgi:hypothetical protein
MKKFIITEEEKNYIKNLYEQVATKIKVTNADVVKQQLGNIDLEKYLKKFNENSSVVESFVNSVFNGQLSNVNSKLKQNLPPKWGPVDIAGVSISGTLNYKVENIKLNSIKLRIMNKGEKETFKIPDETNVEKPQTKYDTLKNKTIDYGRETTSTYLPQQKLSITKKPYYNPPNPWTVNNSTKRLMIEYQIEGNMNVSGKINNILNVNTNATGYIAGFINIYDTSVVTVPPPFTHVEMQPIDYKVVSISLGDRLSWDGDHYLYANPLSTGTFGSYEIADIPIRQGVKQVFSDKTFDFKTYAKNLFDMVSV